MAVRSLGRHLETGALEELTLTTNGSQLDKFAGDLKSAGVERINVSLDTLDPAKFKAITRWGDIETVLRGIDAAEKAGLKVKINTVALKGVNEDEIEQLIRFAHGRGADMTLIETMPLGDIGEDRTDQYLPLSIVRARLLDRFTLEESPLPNRRPGALRDGQGNRWPARLHHAADAQFLRKLQSRARDVHRHALHVSRPGRCRGFARAAARLAPTMRCSTRRSSKPSRESPRATTSSSTGARKSRRSAAI